MGNYNKNVKVKRLGFEKGTYWKIWYN